MRVITCIIGAENARFAVTKLAIAIVDEHRTISGAERKTPHAVTNIKITMFKFRIQLDVLE